MHFMLLVQLMPLPGIPGVIPPTLDAVHDQG